MAKNEEKENLEIKKAKEKALQETLKKIEKDFGKGSIMRLGEHDVTGIDVISTGNLAIDLALGIGGIPKGRIIEIYGPESSGKTTLALHICAEAQKNGGEVAFIDAEHALDPIYAKNLGVDIDRLLVSQPDNGEQALEITEALVRSSAVDLVIVDSVAALVPKAELDGVMGQAQMASQARLMSQALRKLAGHVNKTNSSIVFINQLREKVGVMFGSPEVTSGGRALKYYSSIRIDIRRGEKITESKEQVGNITKIKIVKNKLAPPFKEVLVEMFFGKGISNESTLINLASDFDIIDKAGSWYSYNGEKIGQGMEKVKDFLNANPDIKKEVEEKVRQKAHEATGYITKADEKTIEEKEKEIEEKNKAENKKEKEEDKKEDDKTDKKEKKEEKK